MNSSPKGQVMHSKRHSNLIKIA